MTGGAFLVSRSIFSHPLFAGEVYSRREAWLWLIAHAAWGPFTVKVKDARVALDRGQLCYSHRYLAKTWGWHPSKVRRFLDTLAREAMIQADTPSDTGADTPPNRITICNYGQYQLMGSPPDTPPDTPPETNKKSLHNKPTSAARARGSRLPDDWQPKDAHHDLAAQLGLTTEKMNDEAARFCDYWHAESGQRASKVDWDRAFNTWLRKAAEYGQRPAAGKQAQGHGRRAGGTVAAVRDLLSGDGG